MRLRNAIDDTTRLGQFASRERKPGYEGDLVGGAIGQHILTVAVDETVAVLHRGNWKYAAGTFDVGHRHLTQACVEDDAVHPVADARRRTVPDAARARCDWSRDCRGTQDQPAEIHGHGLPSMTSRNASMNQPALWQYGKSMVRTVKMTFTLDNDTATRIDRTALRLGIPKSAVVREAVAEYAARAGRLSEQERRRMLKAFDDVVERIPLRPVKSADIELAAVRRARRQGGRRHPSSTSK